MQPYTCTRRGRTNRVRNWCDSKEIAGTVFRHRRRLVSYCRQPTVDHHQRRRSSHQYCPHFSDASPSYQAAPIHAMARRHGCQSDRLTQGLSPCLPWDRPRGSSPCFPQSLWQGGTLRGRLPAQTSSGRTEVFLSTSLRPLGQGPSHTQGCLNGSDRLTKPSGDAPSSTSRLCGQLKLYDHPWANLLQASRE